MGLLRRWVGYFIADQGIRDVVQVYEESTARHGYFTAEKLGLFSAYYPPSLILRGGCRPPVERSCSFSGCLLLVCCRLGYVFGDKIQVLHRHTNSLTYNQPHVSLSAPVSLGAYAPPNASAIHPSIQSIQTCNPNIPASESVVLCVL